MTATPVRSYTAIAIAIVIAGILISASLFVAIGEATRTTTTTTLSSVSTTTTAQTVTTTGIASETACSEIAINGTGYCSLDVTDKMTFEQFGYSILNAAVTFMGVTFESTCQSNPANCATESQSTVSSGFIPFELIFPNGEIQYISALYPPSNGPGQEVYYLTTTQVSPRAGFLLEGASTAPYLRVILLVEAGLQIAPTAFTNAADNLQLQLYLNSTSSASGFAMSVNVDDYNTLTSTNNLTANDKWLVALSGLDGQPCWMDSWPVGLAIASGHYTSSNVTTAKFLNLVNPAATYSCPIYITFGYSTGYLFLPLSDVANGYGCQESFCPQEVVTTGVYVTGFWNQGGAFTSFPRGSYTVLAEDEWGNSAFTYFTVS